MICSKRHLEAPHTIYPEVRHPAGKMAKLCIYLPFPWPANIWAMSYCGGHWISAPSVQLLALPHPYLHSFQTMPRSRCPYSPIVCYWGKNRQSSLRGRELKNGSMVIQIWLLFFSYWQVNRWWWPPKKKTWPKICVGNVWLVKCKCK